jgi:predicted nucleotidyltransferase
MVSMVLLQPGEDLEERLRDRLRSLQAPRIKAIVLFGSGARGESRDRSDVDLLILHEGCGIEDPILRRRHLYKLIREVLGWEFEDITILDMELEDFLRPKEISSLLLNIYWDAVPVYDKTGMLQGFLKYVKERIAGSGLRRIRDGRAYRWVLPEPMKEVEIL